MAAGRVPAVSPGRPPRRARHADLALALLPDRGSPAAIPSARAFEIVDAPGTIALDGEVEGLDAREALPPLLGPGMLTDHEGYDAWERRAIGVLARDDLTAEQALGLVGRSHQGRAVLAAG